AFFPLRRFRDGLIDDEPFLAFGRFLHVVDCIVALVADLGLANGLHNRHMLFPLGGFQNRLRDHVAALADLGLPNGPIACLATLFVLRFVLDAIGGRLALLILRLIDELVLAPLAVHAPGG